MPSTKILPLLGFSSRISRRTSVDLPAPEGPTRKRKSPSGTSRLMSRRASVPVGYVLKTRWKLITGRLSKSGVKTIGCVSCCGVTRQRARAARSRAPTGLETLHGRLAVLQLRPLVLARDDAPRRQMRDADRRIRPVDVLPARARRPVCVDAKVLLVDHDRALVGALQLGHHLDQRERRVAAVVLVER